LGGSTQPFGQEGKNWQTSFNYRCSIAAIKEILTAKDAKDAKEDNKSTSQYIEQKHGRE
jgi:hypothetical protein